MPTLATVKGLRELIKLDEPNEQANTAAAMTEASGVEHGCIFSASASSPNEDAVLLYGHVSAETALSVLCSMPHTDEFRKITADLSPHLMDCMRSGVIALQPHGFVFQDVSGELSIKLQGVKPGEELVAVHKHGAKGPWTILNEEVVLSKDGTRVKVRVRHFSWVAILSATAAAALIGTAGAFAGGVIATETVAVAAGLACVQAVSYAAVVTVGGIMAEEYRTCLDRHYVQLELRQAHAERRNLITIFESDGRKQGFFDHGAARAKYSGTEWAERVLNLDSVTYRRQAHEAQAMLDRIEEKARAAHPEPPFVSVLSPEMKAELVSLISMAGPRGDCAELRADIMEQFQLDATQVQLLLVARAAIPANRPAAAERPLNQPGVWDFFISHSQASAGDQCKALCLLLSQRNYRVWYDNNMSDVTEAAMMEGVKHSASVILFLSGDPQ